MTDDEPQTPDAIVDHARLTAQAHGKAMLPEMIAVLDRLIAQRCSTARVVAAVYPEEDFDWPTWGRITYVLEAALMFLDQLAGDDKLRAMVGKRLKETMGDRTRRDAMDAKGDQGPA